MNVMTVGEYKSSTVSCTGDLVDCSDDILDDDAIITVSDDGRQYCVGQYDGNQTWIDLY